jgi:hypothetical protein
VAVHPIDHMTLSLSIEHSINIQHSRSNALLWPTLYIYFGHDSRWPVSVSPRLQHPPNPHPSSWRLPICHCSPRKTMFLFPFHSELVDERRNYRWPSRMALFPLCRSSLILSQILQRPQGIPRPTSPDTLNPSIDQDCQAACQMASNMRS